MLRFVAREVAAVVLQGVQVALVVGGGNYFRGANAWVRQACWQLVLAASFELYGCQSHGMHGMRRD